MTQKLLAVSLLTLLTSISYAKTVSLDSDIDVKSVASLVAKVQKLAAAGDHDITVRLDSGGGDLIAALSGYQTLRDLGVNTRVDRDCSSACTVLFAAGRNRSADYSATFLFHGVKVRAKNGKADRAQLEAAIAEYAAKWLDVVRAVDSNLAAELESQRILIDGQREYSGKELRTTGFVNQ